MKKRALSLFLALALCLSLLPTASMADEVQDPTPVQEQNEALPEPNKEDNSAPSTPVLEEPEQNTTVPVLEEQEKSTPQNSQKGTNRIALLSSEDNLETPTESEVEVFTKAELFDAVSNTATTIKLSNDITIGESLKIRNRTLTLDLNGHTLKYKSSQKASVLNLLNSNLTLIDTSEDNSGTITGGTGYSQYDSELFAGGAIFARYSTITMKGGNITGNSANYRGGGIFLEDASTLTMEGGTITNNSASYYGGGVYLSSGTFNLKDGRIEKNRADQRGGGVANGAFYDGGTINMYGGTISGNRETSLKGGNYGGGGVYNGGKFNMYAGTISNNSVIDNGGGVYNAGTFTMSGDSNITLNYAENLAGGGVYNSGNFIMQGGSITQNACSLKANYDDFSGGGVSNYSGTSFKISGKVTIAQNKRGTSVTNGVLGKDGHINNVFLHEEKPLTIDGDLDESSSIGISTVPMYNSKVYGDCYPISGVNNKDYTANFTSDYDTFRIENDPATNELCQLAKGAESSKAPSNRRYISYTGKEQTLLRRGFNVLYSLDENGPYSSDVPTAINAGTYTIYYKAPDDSTTPISGSIEATIAKIRPYSEKFTFAPPENLVCDGRAKSATVELKEPYTGCGDITLKYYDADNNEVEPENVKDPGTYTVKIDVAGGENFEANSNISNSNWKFTLIPAQAKIGDTYYKKFTEAITDAQKEENTGCTVTLLDDVSLPLSKTDMAVTGGKFTIDLNGKNLIRPKQDNYYYVRETLLVKGTADVTLINSSETKSTVSNAAVALWPQNTLSVQENGKLTIGQKNGPNNFEIVALPDEEKGDPSGYALEAKSGSVTIYGGTFTSDSIGISMYCPVTVHGGTFTATKAVFVGYSGELTVYGGTFNSNSTENSAGLYVYKNLSNSSDQFMPKVHLYGGTFQKIIYKVQENVPDILLSDMLAEGYTFQKENNDFLTETELSATQSEDTLTVVKSPIQSLTAKINGTAFENSDALTAYVNQPLTLTADTDPAEGVTITWYVDDAEVATPYAFSSAGSHTIKCQAGKDGYTIAKTANVTVNNAVSITTQPQNATITYGDLNLPSNLANLTATMESGYTVSAKWYAQSAEETSPKLISEKELTNNTSYGDASITVLSAGTYLVYCELTITPESGSSFTLKSDTATLTVNKKTLTANDLSYTGETIVKTYNGLTDCEPPTAGSVGIIDSAKVQPEDILPAVEGNYTFTSGKDVTDNATVRFTTTLESNDNYILPADLTVDIPAQVVPMPVNITDLSATSRRYEKDNTSVSLTGGSISGLVSGDEVTVDLTDAIATIADDNAGTNKPVTIEGVKLSGKDAGNYSLTSQPNDVTVTIQKAQQTITVPTDKSIVKNGVGVDISAWAQTSGDGDLHYSLPDTIEGISLDITTNELTVTKDVAVTSFTIKVSADETANYNAETETFTVAIEDKKPTNVSITGLPSAVAYGDTITLQATQSDDNTADGSWSWQGYESYFTCEQENVSTGVITLKAKAPTGDSIAITAKYESNSHQGQNTVTIQQIEKKTLKADDLVLPSSISKTYDGNPYHTEDLNVTVKDSAKVNADDEINIGVISTDISYNSKNTDANKATLALRAANLANYQLASDLTEVEIPASITKKNVTISDITVNEKTYDGTKTAEVETVTFDGLCTDDTLEKDTDYTVTGEYATERADATENHVTASITFLDSVMANNYQFADGTSETFDKNSVFIKKASGGTLSNAELYQKYSNHSEKTFEPSITNLPVLPENERWTFIVDSIEPDQKLQVLTCNPDTGALTYQLLSEAAANDTITVHMAVTNANYEDITYDVILHLTAKDDPIVSANPINVTYTGSPVSADQITGTATFDNTDIAGTWEWKADTSVTNVADSGTKTVVFKPTDSINYNDVETTLTLTIAKAKSTGIPAYTNITSRGKTLEEAALNVGTITPAGTIAWDDGNSQIAQANKSYGWTFTPTDIDNYETLSGSITPYVVSRTASSGVVQSSYAIDVPQAENGTIKVSASSAFNDNLVTITVTPNSGYLLEQLTVTDAKNNTIDLTDKGNGTYVFIMPSSKVTVKANFEKEKEIVEVSPFKDVSTDAYYYAAVKWAAENGITGGISADLFAPNVSCTRAQIVTFLWRAAGSPEPKSTVSFTDVPANSYYAKAVAWAMENHITVGTSATTFGPNNTCTRAHVVTFLFRAAKASAPDSSLTFSDVAANAYYADAIKWATENNITSGIGDGLFGPNSDCTRAQIITFLWHLYSNN